MKKLISLLLLFPLTLVAADKNWLHGKLLSDDVTNSQKAFSNAYGGGTINLQTADLVIDAGDRIYFAQLEARARSTRLPQVTENADVLYAIDKEHIYIRDDRGKEVKLRLLKTRMKGSN